MAVQVDTLYAAWWLTSGRIVINSWETNKLLTETYFIQYV